MNPSPKQLKPVKLRSKLDTRKPDIGDEPAFQRLEKLFKSGTVDPQRVGKYIEDQKEKRTHDKEE